MHACLIDSSHVERHVGKEINLRIARQVTIASLNDRMAVEGRPMRMYLWVYSMSRWSLNNEKVFEQKTTQCASPGLPPVGERHQIDANFMHGTEQQQINHGHGQTHPDTFARPGAISATDKRSTKQ